MRLFYLIIGAFALGFVVLVMKWDFGSSASSSKLSDWAVEQIDSELSIFKDKKLTKADIDDEFNSLSKNPSNSIMRFQIIDGRIYSSQSKDADPHLVKAYRNFHKFFASLIEDYDFKENVDFIISRNGRLENITSLKVPVIVPFKSKNQPSSKYTILAPDHYVVSEWDRLYDDIIIANDKYAWDRKIERAFWRGKSSAIDLTDQDWSGIPRVKLVELSTNNPSLIDAKFTKFVQNKGDGLGDISSKFPIAMAVSQADHVKHKMQIYVEGGISSVSADLWRLLSNTITIRQKSDDIRWFDAILKEGEHYITASYYMSDLLERVNWVLDHDAEAKKIAYSSTDLIKKEITPNHLYLYWKHILTEISKLQG